MSHETDTQMDAQEARYLITHPMFKGAFSAVRENLVQAIEDNLVTNELQRDKLMLSLQLLRSVKEQIEAYVINGRLEKLNTEDF
jgi:hypothetical protein